MIRDYQDRHYNMDKKKINPIAIPFNKWKSQQQAVYVQDISSTDHTPNWTAELNKHILPSELATGHALKFYDLPTPGVHTPSFYYYINNQTQTQSATDEANLTVITDIHNESQRLGFWHLIFPQFNDNQQPAMNQSASAHQIVADASDNADVLDADNKSTNSGSIPSTNTITNAGGSSASVDKKTIQHNDYEVDVNHQDIEILKSIVQDPMKLHNTALIDFMIIHRIKSAVNTNSQLNAAAMPCAFFNASELCNWNWTKIPKYRSHANTTLNNLFASDILLIPLSFQQHFSLVVLYNASQYGSSGCQLEHYDSNRATGHLHYVENLCKALRSAYELQYADIYSTIKTDYQLKPTIINT